jgi:hypothetical protein
MALAPSQYRHFLFAQSRSEYDNAIQRHCFIENIEGSGPSTSFDPFSGNLDIYQGFFGFFDNVVKQPTCGAFLS